MRFSISTLTTLLRFIASILYRKNPENKNIIDDIIIADASILPDSQQFIWRKGELARLVKELREMDIYGGSFTKAIRVDKILFSGDDYPISQEYNERLARRIISFITEAEIYGLTIGNSVRKLLKCLKIKIYSNLISLLMESNNVEVKAAVISVFGWKKDIWDTYFPEIEKDEELQKRILELIDFRYFKKTLRILRNWGTSLSSSERNIKVKPGRNHGLNWYPKIIFPLYVKYLLQHLQMSPKQVIIDVVDVLNFEDLKMFIYFLANEYVPTEKSADFGVELAIILSKFSCPYLARDILSKSNWNLLSEKEKLKFSSIFSIYKEKKVNDFLLASHFNLESVNELDFSNAELVEKLLRSGNVEVFWYQRNRIFNGTFSHEAVMKIGEIAALLLLEVSRNPTKYSWVSTNFDTLLFIIDKTIDSCQLSFNANTPNPVMAALDLAFDGGEIVDLVARYHSSCFNLGDLIDQEEIRGRYRRDVLCRFAFKKLIGDDDYYKFCTDYFGMGWRPIINVILWKEVMEHTAVLRAE